MTIRAATTIDIPALSRLCGELGYVSSEAEVAARFARIAVDGEHAVLVAAEANGAVLGWVQVHLTKIVESDPRGEVVGMVVATEARRRGVGAQLMQAAENWAKERDAKVVSLGCNATRADAHRFYEKLGYRVAKTQLIFRKTI